MNSSYNWFWEFNAKAISYIVLHIINIITNIWYDGFLIFTEYIGCPHFVTDSVCTKLNKWILKLFSDIKLNSYYLLYFNILLSNFKCMAGTIYFL